MSSDFRTTLSAPAKEFHDPRNLPYEAVRRAWWNGVWWSIVWIVIAEGITLVVLLAVYGQMTIGESTPSGTPTTAPGTRSRGTEPPPNISLATPPGATLPPDADEKTLGQLPRRRPARANEPYEASKINPLFPLVAPR